MKKKIIILILAITALSNSSLADEIGMPKTSNFVPSPSSLLLNGDEQTIVFTLYCAKWLGGAELIVPQSFVLPPPVDEVLLNIVGYSFSRFEDSGGQVASVTNNFHGNKYNHSYITFKPNRNGIIVNGVITIHHKTYFVDGEELSEYYNISYTQHPAGALSSGKISSYVSPEKGTTKVVVKETIKPEGGLSASSYRYSWEIYDNGEWRLLNEMSSKHLEFAPREDDVIVRRLLRSGTQSAYSNECLIRGTRYKSSGNYKLYSSWNRDENDRPFSISNVIYYDGLGRPAQSINIKGSYNYIPEDSKNIVSPFYYDEMGRNNERQYLSYVSENNTIVPEEALFEAQQNYYEENLNYAEDAEYAFHKNVFDNSPLDRIVEIYKPGAVFQMRGKSQNALYLINNESDSLSCISYIVDGLGNTCTLKRWSDNSGLYLSGELHVVYTRNEDGVTSFSFSNKSGQNLLTRIVSETGEGRKLLDTYYVYDNLGNLCYILPPELSARLIIANSSSLLDNATEMEQFAYIYKYDARNRCISKKLPGAEWIHMVYDKGDRLVMSQDGNMRSDGKNQWIHNTYDALGRTTKVELISFSDSSIDMNSLQGQYDNAASPIVFSSLCSILSETVYDTYPSGTKTNVVNDLGEASDPRTKGLITYEKIAIIEGETVTQKFVNRTYYYDYKGRLIQTIEKNPLGGISRYSTKYDFVGNVLKSYEAHTSSTTAEQYSLIYIPYKQGVYLKRSISQFGVSPSYNDPLNEYFNSNGGVDSKYLIHSYMEGGFPELITSHFYYYIPVNCEEIVNATLSISENTSVYQLVDHIPGYSGEFRKGHAEESIEVLQGVYLHAEYNLKIGAVDISVETIDPEGLYLSPSGSCSIRDEFLIDIPNGIPSDNGHGVKFYLGNYYYIPLDCTDIVAAAIADPNNNGRYSIVSSLPDWFTTDVTHCWRVLGDIDVPEPNSDTKLTEFTYDHRGRLLSETTTLNSGTPAIVSYGYNELGMLTSKTYGEGDNTISETYDYNIQGWLTEKKSDVFDMRLRYYDPQQTDTEASYTGNITEWEWKHKSTGADSSANTYAFTYDKLSRLTDSQLFQLSDDQWQRAGSFEEWFGAGDVDAYDKNGNILSLMRSSATGDIADEFRYEYNGNQLAKLYLDWNDDSNYVTYAYDANGNCTTDELNALKLEYNYLNLTGAARDMSDNLLATYRWLADGTKVGVADANGTGFDYVGSLIYRRNGDDLELESTGFGGGRIVASEGSSGTVYTPNYFLTDHLGSTRAIVSHSGEVLDRSDYYPYGLKWEHHGAQVSDNRWLYNGKELQTAGIPDGSNYLDYGARIYLPRIGRFKNPDPLAELMASRSPYGYCLGNPVRYIDFMGLAPHGSEIDGGIIDGLEFYGYPYPTGYFSIYDYFGFNYTSEGNRPRDRTETLAITYDEVTPDWWEANQEYTVTLAPIVLQGSRPSNYRAGIYAFALIAVACDGPLPIGDIVAGVAIVGHLIWGGVRTVEMKEYNPSQYKRISDGEIKEMQKKGFDPHENKPKQGNGAQIDFYKDKRGNIYYRIERGNHYEPIGRNIREFR